MDSNILNQEGPWTKEKFKLWSPNFQETLSYLCLKSIANFVGVARLIWMPHPLSKIVQIHLHHPVGVALSLENHYWLLHRHDIGSFFPRY